MMKTQAIIAAGGVGTRLGQDLPKPLVKIHGKPILAYTLKAFEKSSLIDSVILVGHKQHLDDIRNIVEKFSFKKVQQIVAGGKTRCESVYQGLRAVSASTKIVVVHDAARPCISSKIINQSIRLAKKYLAVVVAVPVKSTIKEIHQSNLTVKRTLPRETLWEIQTPQVFRREILFKAYQSYNSLSPLGGEGKGEGVPTDDATLVEHLKIPIKIFRGEYKNIKVTTPEDLIIVKNFLINPKIKKQNFSSVSALTKGGIGR